MFGIRLLILLAVMGGLIAFIADKLGSKIGKKRLTVFGLRPHDTSVLLTVLTGVLISLLSMGILAVSSESARTALFGMEKLQRELASLNKAQETAKAGYERAMELLQEKNAAIAGLDARIKAANADKAAAEATLADARNSLDSTRAQYEAARGDLVTARSEVQSLTQAKETLNAEIQKLEEQTGNLRKGLAFLREGQMVYRSGEVVFAGVLKGGLSVDESRKQVNWLLGGANSAALNRLGAADGTEAEVIWTPKEEYVKILSALEKSRDNLLVRVRSVANTVAGQPILCQLEIMPNKLIYRSGQKIYSKVINLNDKNTTLDTAFMEYLQDVNKLTVEAGVLPDPLSGKVGNLSAVAMVETVQKMQRLGGQVLLEAYAAEDIATAGPVQLRLEVERVASLP